MKIAIHNRQRGIAIIIVMVSIFILAALAAAFAYSMKVETRLAMHGNSESEMEWLGRAGIERARWLLGNELILPGTGQRMDALNQRWARGTGETNEILAAFQLDDINIGHGVIKKITITDTERKFNINTVLYNDAVLHQALILMGADASDIPTIVSSVQDWIDRDDDIHINGAETSYYQGLDTPYSAKNGPIDDLSELLLVKGVTPELYWGPNAGNHPTAVFQNKRAFSNGPRTTSTSSVPVGMVDLFTPVSSGLINMNTAYATVFQMLGMEEEAANHLVSLRAGLDGVEGTEDDVPFSNVGEVINAVPNQAIAQQIMRYLTVRSATFEVQVDAEIGTMKRSYYALIRRNGARDVQILNLRWD